MSSTPVPLPGALALAADAGPLVGRAGELAALETAWEAVADQHPRLCLLTGEAGIGKSRLIAELARGVAAGGAPVLYGGCREMPGVPYEPFVDALTHDLRGLDAAAVEDRLGPGAGDLALIVGDLHDRYGSAAHAAPDSPEREQLRLFGAVGEYLQRRAQPRALVVIDDIHWAEAGTLAMLAHILRTASRSIMLVASSRDAAPDVTGMLATFLADLGRHPAVQRIRLRGLTEPDVEELLRETTGGAALDVARTARMLHEATDGSPLFLREIVRELPADGLLLSVPVNATVREHVAERLARLPENDGAVLEAASVLGAEFAARTCAQVLERALPSVLDALDRAAALGVIAAVPGAAGRFAFTHTIVREVLYDEIPAGRRMRLHHAAGTVLRAEAAPVADLARHFYEAADLGDREDAFTYARRAGELARERFAFADAAVHFEQAAQLATQLPGLAERDRCELAIARGEALHRAGDGRFREVLLEAADTARRLDDADLLTRAALALSQQGWTISARGSGDKVVAVAQDALDRVPTSYAASRARLKGMIAAAIHLGDDREAGRRLGAEALAAARASGDPNVLGEILITAHWSGFDPLNVDERLAWAQEACDLAERTDNPVVLCLALRALGQDRLERGEVAQARLAFDRADRILERLDLPFLRVFALSTRATVEGLTGRLHEAERLVADCLALARRLNTFVDPTGFFHGGGSIVLIERGQWERAVERLEPVVGERPALTAHRAALVMFHARLGRTVDARRHLQPFIDSDFAILRRHVHWAPSVVMLADAATWLRDSDVAASLRTALEPVSGHTAWSAIDALWPHDVALAQLSVVLGDHARAHAYLDAAERLCEREGLVAHRARVMLHRAWALRDAGEQVDPAPAVAAAEACPSAGVAREALLMGLAQ